MAEEPSLPAVCAECLTTTQTTLPGAAPQQAPSRVFRATDGKMRVDAGTMSVITDPKKDHTVVLDHAKKIAHINPKELTPPPPGFEIPGAPPMPPPPEAPKPQVSVEDLGKGLIEGHEVEGKRYIIQPLEPPKPPEIPGMPKPPAMPAKPGMPAPPQAPPPPPMPTVAEVWTSTSLKTPVLTKVKGDFGEQITHCRPNGQEPPPAAFEIPQDYKQVTPPPLKPPVPEMPKPPKPPGLHG